MSTDHLSQLQRKKFHRVIYLTKTLCIAQFVKHLLEELKKYQNGISKEVAIVYSQLVDRPFRF